jgi:hypothetical protein
MDDAVEFDAGVVESKSAATAAQVVEMDESDSAIPSFPALGASEMSVRCILLRTTHPRIFEGGEN